MFKVEELDILLSKFWRAAAGWQYSGFDFEFSNRSKNFVFQVRGLILGIRGYIGKMFKGNKWKLIFQSYTGIQMGGGWISPPPRSNHALEYAGLNRVKENNNMEFTIDLPERFRLDDDWKVCLKSVIMPSRVWNVYDETMPLWTFV